MTTELQALALADPPMLDKLTPRERAFVQHPLALLNPKQAAKECGYIVDSDKYHNTNYNIIAKRLSYFVQHYAQQRMKVAEVTVGRIIEELAAIAFCDPTEFYDTVDLDTGYTVKIMKDVTRLPERMRRAIKNLNYTSLDTSGKTIDGTFSVELHNKIEALKALAEFFGLKKGDMGKGERTTEADQQMLENLTPEELESLNAIYTQAAERTKKVSNRKRDANAIEGKVERN
jgi:Terminase small subunit